MANNNSFLKRQKEVARKKKQDEKLQKRLQKSKDTKDDGMDYFFTDAEGNLVISSEYRHPNAPEPDEDTL